MQDDSYFDLGQIVHRRLESLESQATCGRLTSDDLFKFIDELKHEGCTAGCAEFTQEELEWMRMQEQNARDIITAFKISPPMLGNLSQPPMGNLGSREITPGMVLSLANTLKQAESEPDPFFLMAPRTCTMIYWFHHISKAYRLPVRKLRKCHLRKRTRRLQRERKRYFDHV